ncbi:MAG TPA: MBOAT family O-acyltransferase [Polyangiaceae bacterium]|jgi:alginate O-acetyltransferase complex protein AlgI|nr:MBOAT family O-acyltransferase [Polyangiaceae bacterium]
MSSVAAYAAILAGCILIYWCLPRARQDVFLWVASAAFIATIDWKTAAWLMGFSVLTFVATQTLGGRYKSLTLLSCVSVGGYLAYNKYLPPLFEYLKAPGHKAAAAVVVPLGASYFTFKLIHYVIESTRGHIPRHTFSEFLSYMFFLPMFPAGPIERFDEFLKNRTRTFSSDLLYRGGTRILYGLIKKYVILDLILARHEEHARLVEGIPLLMPSYSTVKLLEHLGTLNPVFVWQYVINGYVGIYMDFSAYTDIAVGLGLFLGVKLQENFDYPFLATNIGDFWKRYHMSLSNWAQRYVYFPVLGATRNAQLALFATMLMIGLWHAGNLNYFAWGLYQASMLSLHLVWTRYRRRRVGREEDDSPFAKFVEGKPFNFLGWALTFMGVCGSFAFSSTQQQGAWAGVRILAALVGIHLNG